MIHFDHNARRLFSCLVLFSLSPGDIDRGGGGLGGEGTGLSESGYREAVLGEAFSSLGVSMVEGAMII